MTNTNTDISTEGSTDTTVVSMRAKLTVESITISHYGEQIKFGAVYTNTAEDNTYSKYTPVASAEFNITNPDLFGKFKPGQKFYVDFTSTTN